MDTHRTRSAVWRRVRRYVWLMSALLVIWLGIVGWLAWSLRTQLAALEAAGRVQPLSAASAQHICEAARTAGQTSRRLRSALLPASPVLRHLGWAPRLGWLLEATPALLDTGVHAADTADRACATFAPAFAALDGPRDARLATALRALHTAPPTWSILREDFAALSGAWQTLPPTLWDHAPFTRFASAAQRLHTLLPQSSTALELIDATWPALPALLGIDQPITLLVLGQNPLELRATGGFIGSLGTVTLDQGRVTALDYRDSAAFDAVAPAGSTFPKAYADYLRASQWFLRDANWWPDFARSARTIEAFWELNEQPPVDGVVGVDLYALQSIIQALGPVDVPGYGVISPTASLEAVFAHYEPGEGEGSTDKVFLKYLFEATLQQMQAAAPDALLALLETLRDAFDERHISVQLHDSVAQAAFAVRHWDGAVRETDGDYLQIVNSELSFSDVQGLIDQRAALDILHAPDGDPLTHTLTITYTNRYDEWRAAATSHLFHGNCYSTLLRRNERIPGCSGNYVRLILPPKAIPLGLDGADAPFDIERDTHNLVIGYYLRLLPGQTRTISFTYQPALTLVDAQYTLLLQKQAGTIALPMLLTLRQPGQAPTHIQTDLWRDRLLRLATDQGVHLLDPLPPLHPENTPAQLARPAEWMRGWRLWQAGARQQAVEQWAQTGTLDEALDQVVGLHSAGSRQAANTLWRALDAGEPRTPRLIFIGAGLARDRGDIAAAEAGYREILVTLPDHDASRFQLALLALERDDHPAALAELRAMRDPLAALRLQEKLQLFHQDYPAAIASSRLMTEVKPASPLAWDRLYGLQMAYIQPPDWQSLNALTDRALIQFPNSEQWLWRRADTYAALQQPALALADLQQVTALSPTYALAWYRQGLLSDQLGDPDGAIAAIAQAARLDPTNINYPLYLGRAYRRQDRRDLALEAYQQAARLDPTNQEAQDQLAALEAP